MKENQAPTAIIANTSHETKNEKKFTTDKNVSLKDETSTLVKNENKVTIKNDLFSNQQTTAIASSSSASSSAAAASFRPQLPPDQNDDIMIIEESNNLPTVDIKPKINLFPDISENLPISSSNIDDNVTFQPALEFLTKTSTLIKQSPPLTKYSNNFQRKQQTSQNLCEQSSLNEASKEHLSPSVQKSPAPLKTQSCLSGSSQSVQSGIVLDRKENLPSNIKTNFLSVKEVKRELTTSDTFACEPQILDQNKAYCSTSHSIAHSFLSNTEKPLTHNEIHHNPKPLDCNSKNNSQSSPTNEYTLETCCNLDEQLAKEIKFETLPITFKGSGIKQEILDTPNENETFNCHPEVFSEVDNLSSQKNLSIHSPNVNKINLINHSNYNLLTISDSDNDELNVPLYPSHCDNQTRDINSKEETANIHTQKEIKTKNYSSENILPYNNHNLLQKNTVKKVEDCVNLSSKNFTRQNSSESIKHPSTSQQENENLGLSDTYIQGITEKFKLKKCEVKVKRLFKKLKLKTNDKKKENLIQAKETGNDLKPHGKSSKRSIDELETRIDNVFDCKRKKSFNESSNLHSDSESTDQESLEPFLKKPTQKMENTDDKELDKYFEDDTNSENCSFNIRRIKKENLENDSAGIYSQIDEIILISSDEEDSKDMSKDTSFGPLPFEIEDDSEDEDFELPNLMSYLDSSNDAIKMGIDAETQKERKSIDDIDERKNEEEPSKSEELWWPILSQEFFDDYDQVDAGKNDIEIEPKESNSSIEKSLKQIIDKINSRPVAKSKLTEPKLPPKKTRRKNDSKDKSKQNNLNEPTITSMAITLEQFYLNTVEADKVETRETDFKKIEEQVVPCSSKSTQNLAHGKRKSSNNIRKTLLKTHNLDMYKITNKKPMHHVEKGASTSHQTQNNKDSRQKNSISIQSKNIEKIPEKTIRKGIAKTTNVSRSQKLTEVDMFGSINPVQAKKNSNYKIPKRGKNRNLNKSESEYNETSSVLNETNFNSRNYCSSGKISTEGKMLTFEKQSHKSSFKTIVAQKKKKVVRFDEAKLESIKIISPRTSRDYVGPQNISLREKYLNNFSHASSIMGIPQEFIYKVLQWNYDWLKVYNSKKSNGNVQQPPVCEKTVLPTLTHYTSFDSYKDTFSTLMYYEVWEHIYKDWEQHLQTNAWFVCQIDSIKNSYNASLKFSHVKMFGLITNKMSLEAKHPPLGSLIVMKHKNRDSSLSIHTFGYIDKVTKRKAQIIPEHLKRVSPREANTTIIFDILFSKSYVQKIVPTTLVSISNVSYIRPNIRAFECLCSLPLSQLCPHILNPSDLGVFKNRSSSEYLINQISLNDSQKKAVMQIGSDCLNSRELPQINLIHGPPGTGKTRVISALVAQINSIFKDSKFASFRRILLCAPSNVAVDELVIKLADLKKLGIYLNIVRVGAKQGAHPKAKEYSLDFLTNKELSKKPVHFNHGIQLELEKKSRYIEEAVNEYEMALKNKESPEEIFKKQNRMVALLRSKKEFEESAKVGFDPSKRKNYLQCQEMILKKAEIIAVTLASCLSGAFYEVFRKETSSFACCIVDEAGQCKETETWFPLRLGVKKLILVGDHQQLPATVLSQLSQGKKLHQSLFERVYHHIGIERNHLEVIHCLDTQYRMHESVAAWPSRHFYNNTLITPKSITQQRNYALHPYLIFDVVVSV